MKKFNQLLSLSLLVIVFAACGGSTATPEASVANFLNELQNMDFAGAKKYATEDTKNVLTTLAGVAKMMPTDQIPKDMVTLSEKHIKCDIDGDRANCVVCIPGEECSPEDQGITVVKEGSAWLVSMGKDEMSKDRLNKEDMNDAMNEGFEELDDLDINIDSVASDVTDMLDSLGNEINTIADSLSSKINE